MKKNIRFFVFMMMIIFPGSLMAAGNVMVVTGVEEEAAKAGSGLTLCIEAIQESLKTDGIPSEFIYADLSETAGEAVLAANAAQTIAKIQQVRPAVLIVLNDYSIKYVATKITDIPIVVAYFFTSPESLGLPKPNITGVNRGSFAVDIWKMAKQLTGADSVAMLSKKSYAMAGVRDIMIKRADNLEKASGVKFMDMFLCDTMDEWENQVKNWPAKLMYIIDTTRLTRGEKVFMPEEVVKWTVENSKVPVIAVNEYDTRYGALFSIVTSEKAWGNQAVEMAKKILVGKPVASLPMETVQKGNLLINAKTAEKLKIEIPYEILESADHVYE